MPSEVHARLGYLVKLSPPNPRAKDVARWECFCLALGSIPSTTKEEEEEEDESKKVIPSVIIF